MKQVIVIRKDLKMSAGKLSAQVAHASLNSYLEANDDLRNKWRNESFTKVIVYVKSLDALKNVYNKCKDKNLPCSLIEDEGRTEFNESTITCLGIGPCKNSDFEGVTNKLRLFDAKVDYDGELTYYGV